MPELDTDDGRDTTEGQTVRFVDDDGKENTKEWSVGKDIDLDDLHSCTLGAEGTLTVRLADERRPSFSAGSRSCMPH